MSSVARTLFHEAERLDNRSLDTLITNIISLRVQRSTPKIQEEEALLLKKINKSLSSEQIERFQNLNDKRIEKGLLANENAELLVLLDKKERLNASRLKYITTLARIRNISVRELIKQLGING